MDLPNESAFSNNQQVTGGRMQSLPRMRLMIRSTVNARAGIGGFDSRSLL